MCFCSPWALPLPLYLKISIKQKPSFCLLVSTGHFLLVGFLFNISLLEITIYRLTSLPTSPLLWLPVPPPLILSVAPYLPNQSNLSHFTFYGVFSVSYSVLVFHAVLLSVLPPLKLFLLCSFYMSFVASLSPLLYLLSWDSVLESHSFIWHLSFTVLSH